MKMAELLPVKEYPYTLTHCILVDSSTVVCWTSSFVIFGVSGLFCHFHKVFDGNSSSQTR